MKILQVHNFYINDGGEKIVVENEKFLLQKFGHTVYQFKKNNDQLSFIKTLKLINSLHWSKLEKKNFSQIIEYFVPDIVHAHNLFPQITPSIFEAAFEKKIPVVYTLHNYRLIHPNGLLYHNGKIDERSVKGSAYQCVWDGVYRNSKILTALIAHSIEYHRKHKTWHKYVNKFIVPTEFARKKLIDGGLPDDKMEVKPHFVFDRKPTLIEKRKRFLFLGRVVEEKGIRTILKAWKFIEDKGYELVIAGEGPITEELKKKYNKNVVWLGRVANEKVFSLIGESIAVLFSSEWYETFGLSIIESFSCGVPVICSNLGAHSELVTHELNGLKYPPGNARLLAEAMLKLISNPERGIYFGNNARKEYLSKYTPEKNYDQLMSIYSSVI